MNLKLQYPELEISEQEGILIETPIVGEDAPRGQEEETTENETEVQGRTQKEKFIKRGKRSHPKEQGVPKRNQRKKELSKNQRK